MPAGRRAGVLVALVAAGVLPRTARAEEAYPPTFPIAISVAAKDGVPVRDDAWIAEQIAEANALFVPAAGIAFRWMLRKEIASAHAELHSRDDRDALAALVETNVIDVFVVAALEDVDEPGRYRKGVAWTARPSKKRFIVLSGEAPPKVLAHELGHFFGNPHTTAPDNLMSYVRTGGTVFLDAAQIIQTRTFAERFLASGRLPDVGPARRRP